MIHQGSMREVAASLAHEIAPDNAQFAQLLANMAGTTEQIAFQILTQETS